jgi:hypothetical protein
MASVDFGFSGKHRLARVPGTFSLVGAALLAITRCGGEDLPVSPETVDVGPAGGAFELNGIKITLPAGAVDNQIAIRISKDGLNPSGYFVDGNVYRFSPEGLHFRVPISISFPTGKAGESVFWTAMGSDSRFESLPTIIDGGRASTQTSHFSLGFVGLERGSPADAASDTTMRADGASEAEASILRDASLEPDVSVQPDALDRDAEQRDASAQPDGATDESQPDPDSSIDGTPDALEASTPGPDASSTDSNGISDTRHDVSGAAWRTTCNRQFGTTGIWLRGVTTVGSNAVVVGDGGGDFGNGNQAPYGIFVVAYDSSCNQVWGTHFPFGANSNTYTVSVASDSTRSVYVSGFTEVGVAIGSQQLQGHTSFIFKLNSDGALQWVNSFKAFAGDAGFEALSQVTGTATDPNDDVLASGFFEGTTINFGNASISSPGSWSIGSRTAFIAKFGSDGAYKWARALAPFDPSNSVSAAIDSSGNIAASVQSQMVGSGWLLQVFDTNGTPTWSKSQSGPVAGLAPSFDPAGNLFLAGGIQGDVDFGGGVLMGSPNRDVAVVKYDTLGNHQWSKFFPSQGSAAGQARTDSLGNLLATGYFQKTIDLGTGTLPGSSLAQSAWIALWDGAGQTLWARSFFETPYPGADRFMGNSLNSPSIAFVNSGAAYMAGNFTNVVDFGLGQLSSISTHDGFIARLAP